MLNLRAATKIEFYAIIFTIIIVQLILGIQGLDICDDGFALTFYQQIYNDPSTVEYNFVYWLSGIVGGIWYEIYPKGGVLWFRVFTIIINTLTLLTAYHVFKQFIFKRIAILGLTMVLFVNDFGFLTYYHNNLTALLAILSVFFLLKGITNSSLSSFLISGFIIAINVFTRIPNITLFIFILAIPFYFYIKGESLKKSILPISFYTLGIILGFLAILLLLFQLNQIEIMKKAIYSLFDLGNTKGSTHNINSLFRTYVHQYKKLFTVFCELSFMTLLFISSYSIFCKNKIAKNILLFISIFLVFLWFKNGDVYTSYALGYAGTILVIFSKQNPFTRTLAFIGFLMLSFLILGSNGGIISSGYMCLWLSVPFFFYYFSTLGDITVTINTIPKIKTLYISKHIFTVFILLTSISFFSAKALNVSREAYFDKGNRLNKIYEIDNKLAKNIYTTAHRATIINDLLKNLTKVIKPDDYLLAYDKIPMIHFLTETKPYIYNPWIWIYDSYSFKKKLERAEEEIKIYPIVVAQKFETTGSFSEPIPEYLSWEYTDIKSEDEIKKNRALNMFLEKNNYVIIWSNSFFNIYQTNKKHK